MNYQALSSVSLIMMYEAARGALASDDALRKHGEQLKFRVRETPEWKQHIADLESEMLVRNVQFTAIDWSFQRTTVFRSKTQTG